MHKEGWIVVNSVPVHVQTWGRWIEDDFEEENVLICICGNPGVSIFYELFLQTLFELLGMKVPIWIISYAGLELPPDDSNLTLPSIKKNLHLYNLQGQINLHKQFIKTYLPKDKKALLIGHSVGGKICVSLYKDKELAQQIKNAYLVFPALEHIADTFHGRVFTSVMTKILPVLLSVGFILTLCPKVIKYWLVRFYFYLRIGRIVEPLCIRGTMALLCVDCLRTSYELANDEMNVIKELDHEIYEEHGDQIRAYYAVKDNWAPLEYCDNLKKSHPNVKTVVLDKMFEHAFVLTTSKEFAQTLSHDIKCDIKM